MSVKMPHDKFKIFGVSSAVSLEDLKRNTGIGGDKLRHSQVEQTLLCGTHNREKFTVSIVDTEHLYGNFMGLWIQTSVNIL